MLRSILTMSSLIPKFTVLLKLGDMFYGYYMRVPSFTRPFSLLQFVVSSYPMPQLNPKRRHCGGILPVILQMDENMDIHNKPRLHCEANPSFIYWHIEVHHSWHLSHCIMTHILSFAPMDLPLDERGGEMGYRTKKKQ